MGELERVIWKIVTTGIGIVAMMLMMKGLTSWTEERSAEAKAIEDQATATKRERADQEKDVEDYIQSLHDRETERRRDL